MGALQENLEELAMLEALDNGKPFAIAKAGDVPLVSHLHVAANPNPKKAAVKSCF